MLAIMEFCKPTDQVHFIEVTPRLLQVYWLQAQVAPGSRIGLHVDSLWLTRNDKLHIKIVDASGSTQFSKTINMSQSSARIEFILKQNAQQSLQATVRINRQGQILRSDVLPISANRPLLFAMRWQHTRVARGQLLHLQAECRGISDGTPVHFDLFRHSPNHVGDTPITGFTASVQHNRIDREWQFDIPLSTANLPFPYERHVQTAFGVHYYFLVAHIHQQRFVQAREHYLQFDRDHIDVKVNAAFFPQCQAKLFSSDGKQQSVLLRAGHTSQLSISPGPCLLLIQIDLRQQLASLPTQQGQKYRAPTRVNPILAKLISANAMQWQATTSYIPAPIPSVRWSHASAYAAKPLLADLMTTTEEKAAGIRQSGNLLAIETPNKDAWTYYKRVDNLLLPVRALDACGHVQLGPALAYIDNRGNIHPFILTGKENDHRFALYADTPQENPVQRASLAIWSSSGGVIDINIDSGFLIDCLTANAQ